MKFFWLEEVQHIAKNTIFAVPIERETEAKGLGRVHWNNEERCSKYSRKISLEIRKR